jgi:YVTN family beta-propeller protein
MQVRNPFCVFSNALTVLFICGLAANGAKAQALVYVTNSSADTLSVISTTTNAIVGTIPVCQTPEEVALNPTGTRAYVACGTFGTPGTVDVIDTAASSVIGTISAGLGGFSRGIAVSPDGSRAYVTSIDSGTVGVIDTTSNSVVGTVSGLSFPTGVIFSPDGTHAYVTNGNDGTVAVIDTATLAVVNTIPVGFSPHNLAITPDGSTLYVANTTDPSGSVSVISTATSTTVSTITTGAGTNWPAITPNGKTLYATNRDANTVSVIDTSSNTLTTTIPTGDECYGAAVSGDGNHLYIACNSGGNPSLNGVWVIDTSTNTVSATVLFPAGAGAFGIAISHPPPYNVCLLYDSTKAAKAGSTIPIKLQLCDASGNDLSSSSIIAHAVNVTQISTSITGPVEDSGNANPDNDFRFDSGLGSTGGYIFNLKTTGLTTGTYGLNFTVTGDSAVYAAPFQVK